MTTEEVIVQKKNRREGKGRVIALSRTVYRIIGKDVFYVESETIDGMHYFVMWNPEKDYSWCSCKDHENHGNKCKHIFAIEYAIRFGVVKDTDHLPKGVKKDNEVKKESCNVKELPSTRDEYSV